MLDDPDELLSLSSAITGTPVVDVTIIAARPTKFQGAAANTSSAEIVTVLPFASSLTGTDTGRMEGGAKTSIGKDVSNSRPLSSHSVSSAVPKSLIDELC